VTLEPWVFETVTLILIGLSGVAFGVVVGWRNPLLLASMAVIVAVSIRTILALVMGSVQLPQFSSEAWWLVSTLVAIAGAIAVGSQRRKLYLQSLAIFSLLAASAVVAKYALAIGERHHSDSAKILEIALLIFQPGLDPRPWDIEEKRGFAYPLMLVIAQEGRIFASLTPLIFASLLGLAWWLTRELMRERIPIRWQIVGGAVVLAFSATVPIFRVAYTYLNSHTLMALALLAMVAGYLVAEREGKVTPSTATLMVTGSFVGSTARVEGIVFVVVVLALVVSGNSVTGRAGRIGVFLAILVSGTSLAWWLELIGSDVPDQFGVPLWLVPTATVIGAAVAVLPLVDRIRWVFFPLVATMVVVTIIRVSVAADNPLRPLMSQFNNVVRGYGGWGVAALALAASIVLLGWKARSPEYRQLVKLLVVLIFTALFAKLFDGGSFGGSFGRDGFYDSVNRMWLHTLGIAMVAMTLGYAEFMRDVAQKWRQPDNVTSAPLHFKNS